MKSMITFYVCLLSILLGYSKSKYFPQTYQHYFNNIPGWFVWIGLLAVILLNGYAFGIVSGFLCALMMSTLACCVVPMILNLHRFWMMCCVTTIHLGVILSIIHF